MLFLSGTFEKCMAPLVSSMFIFFCMQLSSCTPNMITEREVVRCTKLRDRLLLKTNGDLASMSNPHVYDRRIGKIGIRFHSTTRARKDLQISIICHNIAFGDPKFDFRWQTNRGLAVVSMEVVDDEIGNEYAYKLRPETGPDIVFRRDNYVVVLQYLEIAQSPEEFTLMLSAAKRIAHAIDVEIVALSKERQ